MQFNILFTLKINHAYYQNDVDNLGIFALSDTIQQLKNGRLIQKLHKGVLYVLVEVDETGHTIAKLSGESLRFGIQILNPFVSNVTDFDLNAIPRFYTNTAVPTQFDPPASVKFVGSQLSPSLSRPERPVTIYLRDRAGQIIHQQSITSSDPPSTQSFDLSTQQPGLYRLEEHYPTTTATTTYYWDPELHRSSALGVIEMVINDSFYTTPPNFAIAFPARQETLKYYVVADRYTDAELSQLSVKDAGFTEDNRPEIRFSTLLPAAFTPEDLSPEVLGHSPTKVVLFKSQTPVMRQEKARRNIRLLKNGDVLIPHLPQPGAHHPTADLMIHLSKP